MHLPDPVFPPLIRGYDVRAPEQAFASAVSGAQTGEFGAGDLVWARGAAKLECALVLEPEVAPARAAEMIAVSLVAFGDCFGALSPPEVALTFEWPTVIKVNGGRVGAVRAAMSAEQDEEGAPRWMVVGLGIDLHHADRRNGEPGKTPDVTNLYEEGCGDMTRTQLLESFSRHLMTWVHLWETEGFREVHGALLNRLDGYREVVLVEIGGERLAGRFAGLDEAGAMLLETGEGIRLLDMLSVVEIVDPVEPAP
jgi:BirA family transcriptional regulator, biotin operon repressor / biotin---[acetyl-CoA-carboxylase] ligase